MSLYFSFKNHYFKKFNVKFLYTFFNIYTVKILINYYIFILSKNESGNINMFAFGFIRGAILGVSLGLMSGLIAKKICKKKGKMKKNNTEEKKS